MNKIKEAIALIGISWDEQWNVGCFHGDGGYSHIDVNGTIFNTANCESFRDISEILNGSWEIDILDNTKPRQFGVGTIMSALSLVGIEWDNSNNRSMPFMLDGNKVCVSQYGEIYNIIECNKFSLADVLNGTHEIKLLDKIKTI